MCHIKDLEHSLGRLRLVERRSNRCKICQAIKWSPGRNEYVRWTVHVAIDWNTIQKPDLQSYSGKLYKTGKFLLPGQADQYRSYCSPRSNWTHYFAQSHQYPPNTLLNMLARVLSRYLGSRLRTWIRVGIELCSASWSRAFSSHRNVHVQHKGTMIRTSIFLEQPNHTTTSRSSINPNF